MSRRVVVTGVGAVTVLGIGAEVMFERWASGAAAGAAAGGAGDRCRVDVPAEPDAESDRLGRFAGLALAAAEEAVEQAGWEAARPAPPERIGCVIGTGADGLPCQAGGGSLAVARRHRIAGACLGTVSDCAGSHAIGTGLRMIQHGDADACVVGGVDVAPDRAHAVAEGAGMLVLEEEGVAHARGATPLALLAGYGSTARPIGDPASVLTREAGAIERALADAERSPSEVDYVHASAATTGADRTEDEAIEAVLGCHARWIPVSSAKPAIGRLLGAAGAVEAVATVLAVVRRTAPPTAGCGATAGSGGEGGAPGIGHVAGVAQAIDAIGRPPLALSNCFGSDGDNAVICVEAAA